jgi:DNA polymerase V
MSDTNPNRPSKQQDDPSSVIAFHAGTDWSSQMHLDLNAHLVMHPSATFFLRVKGNSPDHAAIRDDDILIVDRALTPGSDSTVVAVIDGTLVVAPYRSLAQHGQHGKSDKQFDGPLANAESAVWGVVTYAIHKILRNE